MGKELYNEMKKICSSSPLPCTILSVEKKENGQCGDIKYFAINEPFKRSFYVLLLQGKDAPQIDYDTFDQYIEGKPYTAHLPKEPKFEEIIFNAAWKGEAVRTYVDTTKMYGHWTEDIVLPLNCDHEDNIAYCQFMYTVNKTMDTDKYSSLAPDVSNFIIKTCLELNEDRDFITNMNIVSREIREYTNSFTCSMLTLDKKNRTFSVLSESVLNNMYSVKEVFKDFPYEIIEGWEKLIEHTNAIIITDEEGMQTYESLHPEWVATLRRDNVKSLCLVPFTHRGEILGYLYIANFDINETMRVKETIEIISFFLSSELANYQLIDAASHLQ